MNEIDPIDYLLGEDDSELLEKMKAAMEVVRKNTFYFRGNWINTTYGAARIRYSLCSRCGTQIENGFCLNGHN